MFQEISIYYTSICDDTKHANGIIDATSIGIVLLYKIITLCVLVHGYPLAWIYKRR
jgi:hypothetical protein